MEDFSKVFKCIYYIKNKNDDKMYIGVTLGRLSKRFRHHLWELRNNRHSNGYLQNAYNLNGEDNFEFGYLEKDIQEELLNEVEMQYIKLHSVTDRSKGYNILEGGLRKTHSQETRDKIAKTHKEGIASGRIKKVWLGKTHSEETKALISISSSRKGIKKCSEESKVKISVANKGKTRTIEFCNRMSVIRKGKYTLGDNPRSRPVRITNPVTGIIAEFTNTISAGIEFNICHSFIRDLCRANRIAVKGKLKGLIIQYI